MQEKFTLKKISEEKTTPLSVAYRYQPPQIPFVWTP